MLERGLSLPMHEAVVNPNLESDSLVAMLLIMMLLGFEALHTAAVFMMEAGMSALSVLKFPVRLCTT